MIPQGNSLMSGVKKMNRFPTFDQCMALIAEYKMLPNIVDHSIQVMNVALAVYENLKDKDEADIDLLTAAALLHDIAKTESIETGDHRHDITGGEILRSLGHDEIAEIVENHVVFKDFNAAGPLLEKEIIYYADKRVMHDKVVSLDKRISDLVDRYGINDRIKELIIENKKFVLELEAKIQSHMTVPLDEALKGL